MLFFCLCPDQNVISFKQPSMSPNILYMTSLNASCDDLAPKISLLGRMLPHGGLKVASALDAGCSISWWYPMVISNLLYILQPWNLWVKSSTTAFCVILCHSMYLFGTQRSMLVLIMCGSSSSLSVHANRGFGCTMRGKHHVMGLPSGTFSYMPLSMHLSGHFFSGFLR